MKKVFTLLLCICIMLNTVCLVNAKTTNELVADNIKKHANDLDAVKNLANEQIYSGAGDNISFDNSLAQYIYTDIYGGNYNDTFESHISDDYFWVVFSNGSTKEFRYDSSILEWKDSGSGTTNPFCDKEGNVIDISFNFNTIANIASQKINDTLDEVRLVRFNSVYIIYAKSAQKEYAIPYSSIADKYNISNGEVYIATDLINTIQGERKETESSIQAELPFEEQKKYAGGTTNTNVNTKDSENTEKTKLEPQFLSIIVLAIIISGTVAITIVAIAKHKKH